jgi:hypothetical protein
MKTYEKKNLKYRIKQWKFEANMKNIKKFGVFGN